MSESRRPRSAWLLCPMRMMLSSGMLALAVVAIAVALVGCGSEAKAPSLDGTVGYWLGTGDWVVASAAPGDNLLIAVEKHGDEFWLGVDGKPPRPATLADGRLQLPWDGSGRPAEVGVDGDAVAVFAWVSWGKNPAPGKPTGHFWQPFRLQRLTVAEYRRKAASKADRAMRVELACLDAALIEFAAQHDGAPPDTGEAAADSEFGRWLQNGLENGTGVAVPWPENPYTGEPLQPGTKTGNYTYTARARSYTLVGYLYDGTAFSPKDGRLE